MKTAGLIGVIVESAALPRSAATNALLPRTLSFTRVVFTFQNVFGTFTRWFGAAYAFRRGARPCTRDAARRGRSGKDCARVSPGTDPQNYERGQGPRQSQQ